MHTRPILFLYEFVLLMSFNLEHYKLETRPTVIVDKRSDTRVPFFLCPKIPLSWMQRTCRLPGRVLHVVIVILHLKNLQKTEQVRFSYPMAMQFGLNRYAVYRGLKALEEAGLIRVIRRKGSSPRITLFFECLCSDLNGTWTQIPNSHEGRS